MYFRTTRTLRLIAAAALCTLFGQPLAEAGDWTSVDVGAVGAEGGASINTKRGHFRVSGEGSEIGSSADSFHYLYQPIASDATIVARLTSLQKVDEWTKGGLMLRQTLASGSINASLLVTASNGILFQRRTSTGSSTALNASAGAAPQWLRLVRTGTNIAASVSADGVTWTTVGTASVPFSGTIYGGMAVASHRASRLATASFNSVDITTTTPQPPGAGLVAAWSFDEGSGSIVRDEFGLSNGTLDGATWTSAGKFGRGLVFDGAASTVAVDDGPSLDLTDAMTIEAWVYPVTLSSPRSLMMKEGPVGPAYALYANGDNSAPVGLVAVAGADRQVAGSASLPLNKWSHVAVTYDSATLSLFVNGVQMGSNTASGSLQLTDGPLRIGGNGLWGEFFHGVIDNVRLYRRALTASEITENMTTPVPPAPAPADVDPPVVAVTAPAGGTTISGVVTVSAGASDNVAVTSVQLLVNGASLGAALAASPYAGSWDTTGSANGTYSITAVARDAAGNLATSVAVSVTVSNTAIPPDPQRVQFTSADHNTMLATGQPAVSGYTLEVWRAGSNPATSQPYLSTNIGKPAASGSLVTTDQEAFLGALPRGQQYFTTVTATGPGGSARSAPSDLFVVY